MQAATGDRDHRAESDRIASDGAVEDHCSAGGQAVAQAAVDYIVPKLNDRSIVGVGTGSTANFFIDLLAKHKGKLSDHHRGENPVRDGSFG